MTSTGSQSQTDKMIAASAHDRLPARKAMTMQAPQYLRADQCAQQTLIRLVGSYAPPRPPVKAIAKAKPALTAND